VKKRKNKTSASAGADSEDLAKQARKAVKRKADYVTILIGHNDVCDDDFAGIPSDAEFETNVRAAFEVLRVGLLPGATVYTVGMIDLHRLWQIGEDLTALGVLDCQEIWENELFDFTPCGTMFGPNLTEDRLFTRRASSPEPGVAQCSEYEPRRPPLLALHGRRLPARVRADDVADRLLPPLGGGPAKLAGDLEHGPLRGSPECKRQGAPACAMSESKPAEISPECGAPSRPARAVTAAIRSATSSRRTSGTCSRSGAASCACACTCPSR
jgi:hypothetical protein